MKKLLIISFIGFFVLSCSAPRPSVRQLHTEGSTFAGTFQFQYDSLKNGQSVSDFFSATYSYQQDQFVTGLSSNVFSFTPYLGVVDSEKWSVVGYFSVRIPTESYSDMPLLFGGLSTLFIYPKVAVSYHPHSKRVFPKSASSADTDKTTFVHNLEVDYNFEKISFTLPISFFEEYGQFGIGISSSMLF